MKTYDKTAAYHAVMDRIRETVELPPNRAPQSWLAEQLGISRQVAYVWEDKGIPEGHADTIAKLLDMEPAQVCPGLVNMYLPERVFNAIVQRSTKRRPFNVVLVELIERGLGLQRPIKASKSLSAPSPPKEQPMKPIGGFIPISAEELQVQREEALKAGADLSVKGRSK